MNRFLGSVAVGILGLGLSVSAQAQTNPPAPADNTRVNSRDRNTANPTADQQKGNPTDLDITRRIRRSITEDKALSTYAKNIKVITKDGSVILRGPVRSQADKKAIEAKANEVAGSSHVKSEIEIASKPAEKQKP